MRFNRLTLAIPLTAALLFLEKKQAAAQACPGLASITLNVVAAPEPTISAPPFLCTGGSGTASIDQIFTSYAWSTGATTKSIPVNGPGTFSAIVTNSAGCTGTASVTIDPAATPVPDITASYGCTGTVALDAGTGFQSYAWSNGGGTGQFANYSANGTYSVTVTNATGCSGTDNFAVSIPAVPSVAITGNASLCPGSTSVLTATAGFNTYLWSNAATGLSITVVAAGSFSVTATDGLGCTATASFVVNAAAAPAPDLAGPASICSGQTATFTVGGGPFDQYSWSNGETSATITTGAAGTIEVTVTNAGGCTASDSQVLTVGAALAPVISQQPYQCNGQITLDAGPGFASYQWVGGQSGQTLVASANGSFSVTVGDGAGCTGTASASVSIPAAPVVAVSGPVEVCPGGVATLSATAGFPNYLWSNAASGQMVTVGSGSFSVIATDGLGCTAAATFLVNAAPEPAPDLTGPASICSGQTAAFSVAGGPFSQYSWSTGETTATISTGTAGPIGVTVTNASGCTASDSQNLTVGSSLQPAISQQPYQCNGQVTLDAGSGFAQYIWSGGGATGQFLTTGQGGTFAVTVSDGAGCSGTASLLVDVPVPPTVAVSGQSSFCENSSTVLTATAGFASYLWSTDDLTASTTAATGGNFSVTATDGLGCTATASLAVTALQNPQPVVTGPQSVCAGNTATFTVAQNFAQYNWSTGETGKQISTDQPGSYTVIVADANGCTGQATVNLTIGQNLSVAITELPYNCDGQITLDAGGGFPLYFWSNGPTAQSITVSQSGTYTITVSDGAGCTGEASITVNVPQKPVVGISGPLKICPGGSAELSATAGFQSYQWSDGGLSQKTTATAAGPFTVTATDADGCTATATATVETLAPPAPQITGSLTICGSQSTVLSVVGSFASYLWSNTASGASVSVNAIGPYSVTVTDAAGCTGAAAVTVTASGGLSPVIAALPYNCDGQVTLDAGPGFQTYQWSVAGAAAQVVTISQSGSYAVTVSDGGGCSGTASIAVTVPALPTVAITGGLKICLGGTTALTATAGFQKYQWSNGGLSQKTDAAAAGPFSVTATDANGCTAVATVLVETWPAPQPVLQANEVFCDGTSVTINTTTSFQKYQWSDGSGLSFLEVFQTGGYGLTVTDANGCTGAASINIQAVPPAAVAILGSLFFCENSSTVLTAAGSAGSYQWSTGAAGPTAAVSAAGPVSVTVTDANGCTAQTFVEISEKPAVSTTVEQFSCKTGEVGEVVLTLQTAFGCDSLVTVKTLFQQTKPGLALDLPAVVSATFGQQTGFDVGANFAIDSLSFGGPFALSCGGCLSPTFTPTVPGAITVTAFDADGCPVSGQVLVKVSVKKPNIFVPNAVDFTKGGFTIYAGADIAFVRNFNVYDRWGEALFSRDELPVNDPSAGWDGLFRGNTVQPGVYVYYFEVAVPGGGVELFKGDVTVVRQD